MNDSWLLKWDGFIICFALFNAICIPLSISFDEINTLFSESVTFTAINVTSYVFFTIDILIVANTSFFNLDGDEITDRKEIICAYLKGTFILDLLSTIPFDYLSSSALL